MIFNKKRASKPKNLLRSFEKVSCEDCRFMRRESSGGEEGYICLARVRRRIDPGKKKECQRFLKKNVERKRDVEIEKTISDTDDIFDMKHLYELMSGKDK